MKSSYYLTPIEYKALSMLIEEKSYAAIKRECSIGRPWQCPSTIVHSFIASLKKKTGIENPRDPRECQLYLTRVEESPGNPTKEQREIMHRVLGLGAYNRHTFPGLALKLEISTAEAEARWKDALQSIGIFSRHLSTQRVQARFFFAAQPTISLADAPGMRQLHAARLYAQGKEYHDIALEMKIGPEQAQKLVQCVVTYFGVSSRGRGVQRQLLAVALEAHDKSQQIDMSDPAF